MSKAVTGEAAGGSKARIFTLNFVLACSGTFAFFSSFQLLLPTLPIYIVQIGGSQAEIGLLIGVFTVSAVALRPFIGRDVDKRGRRRYMLLGAFIFFASGVLYNFVTDVPALLLLRLFHGAGIAAYTTAAAALVADLAPRGRMGEAMGYYGMFPNVAMAVAPALGIPLVNNFSFTVLFIASAVTALMAILLTAPISETDDGSSEVRPPSALFSQKALFPSFLVFCLTLTYGAIVSFLPIYAKQSDIMDNPGLFFTVYAIVLIAVRSIAGRLSDVYGRQAVIIPGLVIISVAMVLLSVSSSITMLLLVAALYGAGFGTVHPALMAFLVDKVGQTQRGAAMGTFTAAFDLGIGLGSILWGVVLQMSGFGLMFFVAGLMPLAGVLAFPLAGVARARRAEERT